MIEYKIAAGGNEKGYNEKDKYLPVHTVFAKADHEAAIDIPFLPFGVCVLFRCISYYGLRGSELWPCDDHGHASYLG
jgi:hypothetical protein